MITIFHILGILGLAAGAVLGGRAGSALLGMPGAVLGAAVGAAAGWIAGTLPGLVGLWYLARRLGGQSTGELRASLRSGECPAPNCVLLELRRRGEDIGPELPLVLDLLESDDVSRRSVGWAALTSAYPELAERIPDYRIGDSPEECRRKAGPLRTAAASSPDG